MANSSTNKATTAGDVLAYIPNLIGYLRILLTLLGIALMICRPRDWEVAILCYVASFAGDLFDGMAARRFDQCSAFGGLLDMVTDRCSTAGLLCVLSREYSDEPALVLVSRRRCRILSIFGWCEARPKHDPRCSHQHWFWFAMSVLI